MAYKEAIFGGGCFWCLDAIFRRVDGVIDVISGYANGHTQNPTYKEVCTDTTGYAEVVKIIYDDTIITYEDLVKIFFAIHDPTTLNRQGADYGSQYRSIIVTVDDAQSKTASKIKEELQRDFTKKIVTVIEPLKSFYMAEDYHQNYYANNPYQGYCQAVIAPKIQKFTDSFGKD